MGGGGATFGHWQTERGTGWSMYIKIYSNTGSTHSQDIQIGSSFPLFSFRVLWVVMALGTVSFLHYRLLVGRTYTIILNHHNVLPRPTTAVIAAAARPNASPL